MINLKKVGLTALAGSLVAFSANTAELTVTGGVEVTYTDYRRNWRLKVIRMILLVTHGVQNSNMAMQLHLAMLDSELFKMH